VFMLVRVEFRITRICFTEKLLREDRTEISEIFELFCNNFMGRGTFIVN
jgi:hypothetical protein